MRNLLLVLACLFLASCGSGSVETSLLKPRPPASMTTPCAGPVALPERALTDAEVEVLWGRDRTALRACGERHAALAGW